MDLESGCSPLRLHSIGGSVPGPPSLKEDPAEEDTYEKGGENEDQAHEG